MSDQTKPFKPVRVEPVTLPTLSFKDRTLAYLQFVTPIEKGRRIETDEEQAKEPADIARVIDLETGEMFELVCPMLLVTALTERVPNYVGLCFEIQVSAEPRPGKKYKDVTVFRIECPDVDTLMTLQNQAD